MGKLNQFDILITTPAAVVTSGQVVQGHLLLDLGQPMKMKGLRLRIVGEANVKWYENHSGSGNRKERVSAQESYFDHMVVLFGKLPGEGGDNPVHPAGQFQYPFQFVVPPNAPSSFETDIGQVRYTITGTIDKPWNFDQTTTATFTVINPLDLNKEPLAMSSRQGQHQMTLCCLWCKSGPIEATCRLDRIGYVPGESISINAEVSNGSNRTMSESYAELIQCISFHAMSKSKHMTQVVARLDHSEILPGDSDVWSGDMLFIPPLPPSRLDGCRIIDIRYVLRFCVEPKGPAYTLGVPLEILIGSIPHQAIVQQHTAMAIPPQMPPAPVMPNTPMYPSD